VLPNADGLASRPSVAELTRFFLWLGTAGFGGPIALVGAMDRTLVDERRWVSRQEFADGLAFCQLAPGPLAAQLAIYIGWLKGGVRGATAVGVAFIGPSFVMVVLLAILYQRAGGMPWLQGAFYGIGAAVIAVIARSAFKLARATLGRDTLLWALFAVSAVVTVWTESEIIWVFLLAGVVAVVARGWATWARGRALSLTLSVPSYVVSAVQGGPEIATAWTVFAYFAMAGLFVFGSGLAIVPFLHAGVVVEHGWLTERQFLDAVAVALITPGPVVITVAFIGYLIGGLAGASAAAAGVFAPVYVITLFLAPHYQRLKSNANVSAFVEGVTAAATGAIAGAAIVLGRRAIVDVTALVIAATALVLLMLPRRIPEPLLIVAAGVAGVLIRQSIH
jgi:chromate transporter